MLNVLNFLLGDGRGLYPFERRFLEEVKVRLSAESSLQLQQQIAVINKIQRLSGGKEVNLYQMQHGKPAFDDGLRFLNTAGEVLLASANLGYRNNQARLKVEAWLAKGRLFSLAFDKSPKQFFDTTKLKIVRPEITDIEVWLDPARLPG